jgi:hypothetical protein
VAGSVPGPEVSYTKPRLDPKLPLLICSSLDAMDDQTICPVQFCLHISSGHCLPIKRIIACACSGLVVISWTREPAFAMSASSSGQHKYACCTCARRKIKCDKADPCSNCSKAQVQCLYEEHPPPRPRKRAADEDLIARLGAYEDLLRKNNVDFSHFSHAWIPSDLQGKLKHSTSGSESPALTPETNNLATSEDLQLDNRSAEWER